MIDQKYIVFKREEFEAWFSDGLRDSDSDQAPMMPDDLDDAVVIRRQDYFAGPALHTYASMIDIAVKLSGPGEIRNYLKNVSLYFHEQAVLADAEGWKVPD